MQNDGAGEQAVGKVQEDAQVVQIAAEVQGLGPVGFEVPGVDREILGLGDVRYLGGAGFDVGTDVDPARGQGFADMASWPGVKRNRSRKLVAASGYSRLPA